MVVTVLGWLRSCGRGLSPIALGLMLCASLAQGEDTIESKLKATDMANADAVFALAEWCKANNLPSKSRQYYSQVIKLDRDHEGARTALGQVKVGERWVAAGNAGATGQANPQGGGKTEAPAATGKVPSTTEVGWNLTVPRDPEPDNPFVSSYVEKLNTLGNDSDELDAAVNTIIKDDLIASGIPRLCAALQRPDFTDLYGASMVVTYLIKPGPRKIPGHTPSPNDRAYALAVLPFLVKASERVDNAEDLATFSMAASQFRDKRVLPRLIELLEHKNPEVQSAAASSISFITTLPMAQVNPASVKVWWSKYANVTDQQMYLGQLKSSEPLQVVAAANALIEFQDKSIIPALIKVLRGSDPQANARAMVLIERLTNSTWGIEPAMKPEERAKRVDLFEKWWKDNGAKYSFPDDPLVASRSAAATTLPTAPIDQSAVWVKDLASVNAAAASAAQNNLEGIGFAAVPALLDGLNDAAGLIRVRSVDLLKRISKKGDIAFDANGTPEQRAAGVAAWRAWADAAVVQEPPATK